MDPDLSKDYLDRIQNRTKEKRYAFDHAFAPESKNSVYVVEFICYGFLYVFIARLIICFIVYEVVGHMPVVGKKT